MELEEFGKKLSNIISVTTYSGM